jgi:hypothetical protein
MPLQERGATRTRPAVLNWFQPQSREHLVANRDSVASTSHGLKPATCPATSPTARVRAAGVTSSRHESCTSSALRPSLKLWKLVAESTHTAFFNLDPTGAWSSSAAMSGYVVPIQIIMSLTARAHAPGSWYGRRPRRAWPQWINLHFQKCKTS